MHSQNHIKFTLLVFISSHACQQIWTVFMHYLRRSAVG